MTTYQPPPKSFYPKSERRLENISLTQRIGAIAWPSFFSACVAAMVFFAIIDPIDLNEISWHKADLSREAGYALGFFMFWLCTFSSSLFTSLLLESPRSPAARPTDETH